eukprot:8466186-Karenia_brevis.AAC.1
MVSFTLAEDDTRFGILEQGWQWHAHRPQMLPCVTGFQRRAQQLTRPASLASASAEAEARWRAAGFPTP